MTEKIEALRLVVAYCETQYIEPGSLLWDALIVMRRMIAEGAQQPQGEAKPVAWIEGEESARHVGLQTMLRNGMMYSTRWHWDVAPQTSNPVWPIYAAPPQAAPVAQAEADLAAIYDAFGIGKEARTLSVLLTNLRNMKHFTELLWAVEREFFMVPGEPSDEPEDEGCEPNDECLVNCWGSTKEQYIEQFRAALAAKAVAPVAQGLDVDAVMTGIQEFASTWSVVGGRFDDGTAMERAEECKAEIRAILAQAAPSVSTAKCFKCGHPAHSDSCVNVAPSAQQVEQLPVELRAVAETVAEGAGFWATCTGCYDTEDGRPTQKYAHSDVFCCELGNGCRECGGLGAVWDDTDYAAMAEFMEQRDAAPAEEGPRDGADDESGDLTVESIERTAGICSEFFASRLRFLIGRVRALESASPAALTDIVRDLEKCHTGQRYGDDKRRPGQQSPRSWRSNTADIVEAFQAAAGAFKALKSAAYFS
ncbi:hypothetical protein BJN34_12845 [Cupriavidus necator]|uniref:Uncharacterized protein n=1 Tax=Cupriavidus necator TaxID=106590 RepID=A0A1U9UQ51_CUPNE|nr:hypothetical protein [Cupriavidus necator]AQV94768.1 hypothetical protein BJN34_12845 [Cupriavidus necator]